MRHFVRHIASTLFAAVALCGMSSCVWESLEPAGTPDPAADGREFFALHIASVNTGVLPDDGVAEKIKTLRVIVFGEHGIELNRSLAFDEGLAATALNSVITWYADPDETKDFYIFANEEMAGDGSDGTIHYLASKLPNGVSANTLPTSLKALFEQEVYKGTRESYFGNGSTNPKKPDEEDEEADAAGKAAAKRIAAEFKAILQSVYFSPQYEAVRDASGRGEIYLPYTTFYEGVTLSEARAKDSEGKNNLTMYLVPVATKFFFRFINNRPADIAIWNLKIGGEVVDKSAQTAGGVEFELDDKDKKVMIGGVNRAALLLASVGGTDREKEFADDRQTYYWVDWLAKVSELSHSHWGSAGENEDFNKKYGWISDYTVPFEADASPWIFVDRVQNSGSYPVVTGTDKAPENEHGERETTLGPYYLPESRYMVTYEREVTENNKTVKKRFTEQRYILNLYLHDQSSASTAGVLDLEIAEPIGNVASLFRNTYVYIVVTMNGGDISLDIYAEMTGWNAHSAYGQVTEIGR